MAKVKEPAPHVKAAQIEKKAVRALSVDEVEEALTKSTYGGEKKLEPLDEDDIIIKDIEAENEMLRKNLAEAERCYHGVRIELMERNKEITKLEKTIEELRETMKQMDDENKELRGNFTILKAEFIDLKEENKKHLREIDDYKKTISKMKYAHEEEVRALNDDIMEAKVLGKKAGEYCSMLDADSDTFETILELAKIINGLAKSAESVSLLIKDEIEGHV